MMETDHTFYRKTFFTIYPTCNIHRFSILNNIENNEREKNRLNFKAQAGFPEFPC